MFASKKNIKWSEKDIWDTLYLLSFGICLLENFFHNTYVIQEEKWIGDFLVGSHRTWDMLIFSLVISISLLRFSAQSKVTRIQRIYVWAILFIFSFHYFATGRNIEALVIICLCIGAYNISFPKMIKIYFVESAILCTVVITASSFGIIQNRMYGERASLGFSHPNILGARVLTIVMAYFVWRQAKMTWIEIGIATIVELIIYRASVSRSSFIATMLFLFLCVCYKLHMHVKEVKIVKTVYNVFMFLMCFSVFIFGGITVLLSYFYSGNREWMVKLDQWFSGRLSLGRVGFDKYNLKMLGNSIKMIVEPKEGEIYFFLDSYYLRAVLQWGALIGIVFLMLYFIVSYRAKCLNEFLILSALSILALYGIMERFMGALFYNPYLLFLLASTGTERLVQNKGERL